MFTREGSSSWGSRWELVGGLVKIILRIDAYTYTQDKTSNIIPKEKSDMLGGSCCGGMRGEANQINNYTRVV